MIEISENIYYFPGSVTIMYVRHGGIGLLIDGGLDDQRMKKVVKEIEKKGYPITHMIVTHAHADHFGGVAWLQKNRNIYTYAPKIEASLMESPILEPIYLFGGAFPLPELRSKFLEATPIRVDQVIDQVFDEETYDIEGLRLAFYLLPGHSYNQIGIGIKGEVLYAADSYFSKEIIEKHGVPFIVDAKQTVESLERLKDIQNKYKYSIPGHGQLEQDITSTIEANIIRHLEILTIIESFVSSKDQVSLEEIIQYVLNHYQLDSYELGKWLLYRTSILGYIKMLIGENRLSYHINNHKLVFKQI